MEKELIFIIPRKIFLNSNDSLHHQVKAKKIKALREISSKETVENPPLFDKCDIVVYISPPSRRRFDPTNAQPTVKALIDGLTDAGFWEDDNWRHVAGIDFRYGGLFQDKEEDSFKLRFVIKTNTEANFEE